MSEAADIVVRRVTLADDLPRIAESMRGSEWGTDNEMADYDAEALRRYLEQPGTLLVMAFAGEETAGALLATTILNPYRKTNWLYIDEVDVKPSFRRRGIASKLMQGAFTFAREHNLKEAWLGTEPDNPANHLYKGLDPHEVEEFVGYTYKM